MGSALVTAIFARRVVNVGPSAGAWISKARSIGVEHDRGSNRPPGAQIGPPTVTVSVEIAMGLCGARPSPTLLAIFPNGSITYPLPRMEPLFPQTNKLP